MTKQFHSFGLPLYLVVYADAERRSANIDLRRCRAKSRRPDWPLPRRLQGGLDELEGFESEESKGAVRNVAQVCDVRAC